MAINVIPARPGRTNVKGILIILLMVSTGFAQDGSINERTLEHGDSVRSYLLYVPASYDGTTEWPLAVSYHGYRVDLNHHMNVTRMNIEADVAQYIVAYPQGIVLARPSRT